MGKVSKGLKCSVEECGNEALRSLHADKAIAVGLKVQDNRRAYLCRDHYKILKKATKKDRRIAKWRYTSVGRSSQQKMKLPK